MNEKEMITVENLDWSLAKCNQRPLSERKNAPDSECCNACPIEAQCTAEVERGIKALTARFADLQVQVAGLSARLSALSDGIDAQIESAMPNVSCNGGGLILLVAALFLLAQLLMPLYGFGNLVIGLLR